MKPCPVCSSPNVTQLFRRERMPVQQNLVVRDRAKAESMARADMQIVVCDRCSFIFNAIFDARGASYGQDYDSTQDVSPRFARYVDDLVKDLVEKRGMRKQRIVEVGCGRGAFLRKLVEAGNSGVGFDPVYIGPLSDLDGKLTFRREFFSAANTTPADVVICRHCIGYMENPVAVLRAIRAALADSPQARVCFELQCAEWMIDHDMLSDFAYEVVSYFSADALTTAYAAAGFTVTSVRRSFADQYLWVEGTLAEPTEWYEPTQRVVKKAHAFAAREATQRAAWSAKVSALSAERPIAIWGAGTKGGSFAALMDPDRTRIACIVDINPGKIGNYLPGTGHPIVAPEALRELGVRHAILMNPNYRDECAQILANANLAVELVVL